MAGPAPGHKDSAGWRGEQTAETVETRHRWQSAEPSVAEERLPKDGRGRRILFGTLLIAAFVLLGVFVRSLLLAPLQTPVLYVTSGSYSEPFAPNDWSREDADGLTDLDGKTLDVGQATGLEEFRTQLKETVERQSRSQVAVIVLSMHGAVNDDGEPCVIPAGASPVNSRTWVPISRILTWIKDSGLPDETRKLLILDCCRVRTWWPQGTLHNDFTTRLRQSGVLKNANLPNLVVLNAVGPGQKSWTSPELQGSVFGHFLRRGLAGEADAKSQGGDGDRSVSLRELFRFVARHVDHWSRHHFGESQSPELIVGGDTADTVNFHVAWAYRGRLTERTAPPPAVSGRQIAAHWRNHDRLHRAGTFQRDPLTWRSFQHKLLRLERAAVAGSAYAGESLRLHTELTSLTGTIETQARLMQSPRSLYANLGAFSRDTAVAPNAQTLPSIALAEFLGGLKRDDAATQRQAWQTLQQTPTPAVLKSTRETFAASPVAARSADAHFLQMLSQYNTLALWTKREHVQRILALHQLAAEVAVGTDERVHRPLQKALQEADRQRRVIEDRLFIGENSAPADFGDRIAAAESAYRNIKDRAASEGRTLALRDRVFADFPWLIRWLSDPALADVKELNGDDVDQLAAEIVADVKRLQYAMQRGDAVTGVAPQLEERFRRLSSLYDAECLRLLQTARPDVGTWRRIQALLAVPLPPGQQSVGENSTTANLRDKLRDLRATLTQQLKESDTGQPVGQPESEAAAKTTQPESPFAISRWSQHPLLAVLAKPSTERSEGSGKQPAEESSQRTNTRKPYEIEAELRKTLGDLTGEVRELNAQTTEEPNTFRRRCLAVVGSVRAASALPLPGPDRDPVQFLRRFDLQQLLVRSADRSLDDFWGPAGTGTLFFADATQRQLEAAGILFDRFRGWEAQKSRLQSRLQARTQAARNGLTTTAQTGLRLGENDPVDVRVTVVQTDTNPNEPPSAFPALPPGVAGVSLVGTRGRAGNRVFPSEIIPQKRRIEPAASVHPPIAFRVLPTAIQSAGPDMRAMAMFRGHEFVSRLQMATAEGAAVEIVPSRSTRATVTVNGDRTKSLSIVFVLDCSHSMTQTVKAGGASRHRIALKALQSMLGQLAKRDKTRVGVIFYGHRVGWNAENGTELLRQTEYARRIPEELLPLEDVETVLTLGRFDDSVEKRIQRLTGTVKPWGETPLYLAITEALKQFAGEDSETEKRIVVITDGVDAQRVPKDLALTKEQTAKLRSRADVERAIAVQPVAVHILGFEMDSAEERLGSDDFKQIASVSKGRYLPAVESRALLGTISSLVGVTSFRVEQSDGNVLATSGLGKTATVSSVAPEGLAVMVTAAEARTQIELRGGEAAQLEISKDGNTLESAAYRAGSPIFVPLVDDKTGKERDSGMQVGLHAASRHGKDGSDVDFTISFQSAKRLFPRKPGCVWIEVTPRTRDGRTAGPVYFVTDAEFQSQKPVPVLIFRAKNWPREAGRAEFRVWSRQNKPTPTERIPLASLLADAKTETKENPSKGPRATPLRADVRRADGRITLRIVHDAETSGGFQPKRIALSFGTGPEPVPVRIERRFDPAHGVAVHEWVFNVSAESAIRQSTIGVTPLANLKAGSDRSEKPTLIDVRPAGELIRVP